LCTSAVASSVSPTTAFSACFTMSCDELAAPLCSCANQFARLGLAGISRPIDGLLEDDGGSDPVKLRSPDNLSKEMEKC